MATVNISTDFLSRVSNKINTMLNAEFSAELPDYNKVCSVDASGIYHLLTWGKEHIHLMHAMPTEWLGEPLTEFYLEVKGREGEHSYNTTITFRGGNMKLYRRPGVESYAARRVQTTIDWVRALPDNTIGKDAILKDWEDGKTAAAIRQRWSKVETDVLEFLKKCKSLNEAVKLYPGVRMYCSEHDLERLDKKVERIADRKKLVDQLDTDGLTAAAIAAKLAQAA